MALNIRDLISPAVFEEMLAEERERIRQKLLVQFNELGIPDRERASLLRCVEP